MKEMGFLGFLTNEEWGSLGNEEKGLFIGEPLPLPFLSLHGETVSSFPFSTMAAKQPICFSQLSHGLPPTCLLSKVAAPTH